MNNKEKKKRNDSKPLPVDVTLSKEVMPELLQLVGKIMTRNEKNPLIRQAGQLEFMKAAHDIKSSPDKHLALSVYAMDKQGPNFEAGLLMGLSLAFCSLLEKSQSTLLKMLKDITEQQAKPVDFDDIVPKKRETESGAI